MKGLLLTAIDVALVVIVAAGSFWLLSGLGV